MKNLKKLLISSIVLIIIGLVGLCITFAAGSIAIGSGSFGTIQRYKSQNCGFCNRGSSIIKQENLSFETVRDLSQDYIARFGKDLKISEIMEFSENYYIEIVEEATGIGAMELLVDKPTGSIFPEYGPNMMWNLKYGMGSMMRRPNGTTDMAIDKEKAIEIADIYLAKSGLDEYASDEAEKFYGYYTIHSVDKDGTISGMLSVNGFNGSVWYHNWHGEFIDMKEYH